MENYDSQIERLAELIINSQRIVVFTGAGISTESGIPDFRSPGGIWEKFDANDFTYGKFISDPENRKRHWQFLTEGGLSTKALPNEAHFAIGELYKLGKLDCVITQNIDGLHQKGGVPDSHVFELHGNLEWTVCLKCGKHFPFDQIKNRLENQDEDLNCEICGGILKPDVVMFGEELPELVFEEAAYRASSCDLCIVIGSSLVVYPAAMIPVRAVRAGAKLAIINLQPTSMDEQAAVLIRSKAGEVMHRVLKEVKSKLKG